MTYALLSQEHLAPNVGIKYSLDRGCIITSNLWMSASFLQTPIRKGSPLAPRGESKCVWEWRLLSAKVP